MNKLIQQIHTKAIALGKKIVLPEGEEDRNIKAARIITDKKLAKVTLIGNISNIQKTVPNVDLTGISIFDPNKDDTTQYAELLFETRKAKGLTKEEAEKLVKEPLYLGVLMVKNGDCDGMVSGAIHSTGDVLRPALQIIKTAPGISTVNSCFVMAMPDGSSYGDDGVMIFGDCAVNPDPNANELASIAIASASSAKAIAGLSPRVAMLSFSTKGSAKHPNVDKVIEATHLVKQQCPDLAIDGELQADAALVSSVGTLKAPNSPVAGKANVLIFPDLASGNIGYKLVQRLAGAEAIGPICQGFNLPVNDLSRGCSVDDIVNTVAITVLQTNA